MGGTSNIASRLQFPLAQGYEISNSGNSTERKEEIDVSVLDTFIWSWLYGLGGGGNNEHPEVFNSHQSYDRLLDLAQTIALTDSSSDTQAAPHERYIRQMWPVSGPSLLSLLVRALDTVSASPAGLGNAEHQLTTEPGTTGKENTIDVNNTEALRKALTAGDRVQVESLLADDSFDGTAQGEFAWLLDLKETGSSMAEMTQVLFDASRSTECSLFLDELPDLDSKPTSEELPEDSRDFWDFHQTQCAHRTPNQGDALSFDPISLHLRREEMQRRVAALCGLGGLIPRSNQQDDLKGLTLTRSNASVVYGAEQDWPSRGGKSETYWPKLEGEEAWPSLPVCVRSNWCHNSFSQTANNNHVTRGLGICLIDWK